MFSRRTTVASAVKNGASCIRKMLTPTCHGDANRWLLIMKSLASTRMHTRCSLGASRGINKDGSCYKARVWRVCLRSAIPAIPLGPGGDEGPLPAIPPQRGDCLTTSRKPGLPPNTCRRPNEPVTPAHVGGQAAVGHCREARASSHLRARSGLVTLHFKMTTSIAS